MCRAIYDVIYHFRMLCKIVYRGAVYPMRTKVAAAGSINTKKKKNKIIKRNNSVLLNYCYVIKKNNSV